MALRDETCLYLDLCILKTVYNFEKQLSILF